MNRIKTVDPTQVEGKTKEIFDAVQQQLGVIPNIFKTFAHSPAVLDAYMKQTAALAEGELDAQLREQIALVTAGKNQCDYCASAHTVLGLMAGVSESELASNLRGQSDDPKTQAALNFAARLVDAQGRIADSDYANVRAAQFSDAEIVEIVAHVCLNIFTNYFNHFAGTVIDFPVISTAELAKTT